MLVKQHLLLSAFHKDRIAVKAHDRQVVELVAVDHMHRNWNFFLADVVQEHVLQIRLPGRLTCQIAHRPLLKIVL